MSSTSVLHPDEEIARAIRALLNETGAEALRNWLQTRRWFADKGRDISGAAIEDALIERVGVDWLALAVARVTFADGNTARYLLPLALTESPGAAETITTVASGDVIGVVVDSTDRPWFGGWLLDRFDEATEGARGGWFFTVHPSAAAEIAAARNSPITAVRAEQSNSSLRFGDVLMVKLFR